MKTKKLSFKEKLEAIRSGAVGKIIKIKKENMLVNEKNLIVYKDEDQVEVTMFFGKKKGLILDINWFNKDKVEVRITRTTNGCTECRKPDFKKTYRR